MSFNRHKSAIVSIALGVALAVVVGLLFYRIDQQRIARQQEILISEVLSHATVAGHHLGQAFAATDVLAKVIEERGDIRDFDRLAGSLLSNYGLSSVSTLQLAPDAVISRIFPLAGNEGALGHNLLNDPERRADVEEAIATRQLVLSGPFALRQGGGEGLVGRRAVFVPDGKGGERFWGLTVALIRLPNLLKAAQLSDLANEGYDFRLRYQPRVGQARNIAQSTNFSENNINASHTVVLPNGAALHLTASPRTGRYPSALFGELALALMSGLLLGGFFYQLLRKRELLEIEVASRTRSLQQANAQLEQEVLERTRAQNDTVRSHQFLDSVIENIPHMVFVKEAKNLTFVRVNRAGEELVGLTQEQLFGKSDFDFFPREQAEFFIARDRETLASGKLLDIPEEHIQTQHHGQRILHTRKLPILGPNGEPEYLLGISEDITERKAVGDKLAHSEALFRAIAENANDLIALVDPDGRRIYNNPAYEQVLGGLHPQPGSDSFAEIHPDDRGHVKAVFERTIATGEGERLEFRFLQPDGTVRHIESEGSVIRDGSGAVTQVLVVSRDITERMIAQKALHDQLFFVEQLIDTIPTPVFYKDRDGRYLGCNRAYENMIGRSRRDIIGRDIGVVFNPEQAQHFHATDLRALAAPDQPQQEEARITYADGTERLVAIHKAAFRASDAEIGGLVGVLFDITQRRESEEKLRLAATVFENSGEGIIITDAHNNILMVNKAFTLTTRYTAEEVIGRNPRLLSSGEHGADFYRQMWRSIRETGEWHGEVRNRRKTGEVYTEWLTLGAVYNPAGEVTNYVAIFTDLTARKKAEERLHFLAFYDSLTELPNRVLFIDRLDRALIQARHAKGQVAVMFLDVDRFSAINETLGHAAGDRLLKAISGRLKNCVHQRDSVARMGGDEFTIVLSDASSAGDIAAVAQRVLEAMAQPFNLNEDEVYVSASIGVSVFPGDGNDAETLIRNADSAMHRAIEMGGNLFRFYTLDMNAKSYERLQLGTDLRHAQQRGELQLYYQPFIDVATGKIVGAEALLRWRRQEFGMVPPAAFVPLLEETGMIVPIGDWVLRTACQQSRIWKEEGLGDLFVAVNFSAQQFERQDMVETVRGILAESGGDPRMLEIELTETILMRHAEETVATLRSLKEMGIHLSVDDFGTGYSSLSYLKRFPLDTLKIDRSFVHDAPDQPDAVAIVNAVMAMGHSLNLKIIAEGVETREQLEFLREAGCDIIQGYLVSPALPPDEFIHFARQRAAAAAALPAPKGSAQPVSR
ncbi:MAG TPA: EAL domain-containing protein [Usitatibacteraceae bacterium]|nr:EAL domain-containing protein [Usitatibacteraceae bacterium]